MMRKVKINQIIRNQNEQYISYYELKRLLNLLFCEEGW